MQKVEIYTRPGCGYCQHAKVLLMNKNIAFFEYDVYRQKEKLAEMQVRTTNRTFPQIFIDNRAIGGFEELLKLKL